MALTIARKGFGQVEPNHLSAQRTAQIYAQLPAHIKDSADAANTIDILENGQFVKYDYANGEVNFTGAGEWMMVFNEVKLYDDKWREHYKDYAMIRSNFVPAPNNAWDANATVPAKTASVGEMVPRVIKINIGDIYTTNCIGVGNTSRDATVGSVSLAVEDTLEVGSNGYLVKQPQSGAATSFVFQVVKETTMPDGQPAVKIMRIK